MNYGSHFGAGELRSPTLDGRERRREGARRSDHPYTVWQQVSS